MADLNNYCPPSRAGWQGRTDGETPEHLRWHQHCQLLDLTGSFQPLPPKNIALLGFSSDEGVARNKGRTGAKKGPEAIRKSLSSFSVLKSAPFELFDAGDIRCETGDLAECQTAAGEALKLLFGQNAFPVVLGGGHEVAYAHYCGVRNHLQTMETEGGPVKRLGIVNFDAHFDLRKPEGGVVSSGTPFYQILSEAEKGNHAVDYLVLGLQPANNTQALFDAAHDFGVGYVTAQALQMGDTQTIINQLAAFLDGIDALMLTIDLDVFSAAHAPGVSAPAFNGLLPTGLFQVLFQQILQSSKLLSIDIAELNPTFDQDSRTARLAAWLVQEVAVSRF